jgi:transposase-like protein
MNIDLTNPIFASEDAAREHLEAQRWPNGPFCPHCGETERVHRLKGKSTRPGLFQCNSCLQTFTVMVGSIFESSHIPLQKWVLAYHLMAASKKGMSALQLSRMLAISYKSAWFMCHRIRETMDPVTPSPMGGEGKIVEADETVIGGKAKNRAYRKAPPKKQIVMALIERGGESRSFHVANVTAKTLRPLVVKTASRKSTLMTDELATYEWIGKEFDGHETVNHSKNQYVRDGKWHVNTAECRFSLMKRAVFGTHHSISEAHLHRYLVEWDFKWNTRKMTDGERAAIAVKGAAGKRLTYRGPRSHHEQNAVC